MTVDGCILLSVLPGSASGGTFIVFPPLTLSGILTSDKLVVSVPTFCPRFLDVNPFPLPTPIGTLPLKSGKAKVVLPSPPYVVPKIENNAEFDEIGNSCP